MRIFTVLLLLSSSLPSRSDLIAKSSITICENTGGGDDPMSVVYEKACEKKLIVTMSVRSGQNGSEMLKTVSNVSKVYDEVEREQARLYNPFIITLAKTPVHLTYPYYYRGMVNNKPEEKVKVSDNGGWVSGSRNLCDDMWESDSDESTCGFDRDANGNKIWDSQGFCCWCKEQDKWRGSFSDSTPFSRAGLTCKLFAKAQAAAHCMKYDDLWYTVNELGRWEMEFGIHVKTFDQVTKKEGNVTKPKWVPGGEIVIGPHVRRGRGKYGRLLASYIGEFQSHRQFPTLTEKFLLIPFVTAKIDPKMHPQLRDGPADYMIIDKHEVNYKPSGPHECDKIGVTYTAFRNQRPAGCQQKKGACLNNQPKDYFEQDQRRRASGKTPYYFPEKFGKLVGVKKRPIQDEEQQFMLTYEIDEGMTSMVTLQISADDILLIYNRASGKILKAYAQDFEAVSKDGRLFVVVQNTGYVTADFAVVISECSGAVGKFREKSLSINPQKTHLFSFDVHAYNMKGGNNYCVVKLFDSRQKMVDSANVTFTTTAPCVCATGCGCSCYDTGFKCVERDEKDWNEEKPTESGLDFGGAVNIWTKVKNFFKKLGKVFKFLTSPGGIASILGILVGLGALKAFMGLRKKGAAVARFGMGGVKKGRQEKANNMGQIVVVEYNEEGEEVDPVTKEVTKPRNKTKEFLFNLIFFLILPFLLLFKLGRKIIKRCKKDSNTKQEKEKEKQDENEGDGKAKGSAVDIFKEGDIMKNGSPRAESDQSVKLFTEKAEVSGGSKENVTTERSRINNLVIKKGEQDRGNDIATGGGSQGIKRKISAQGSRRGVKEHVTEPSKDKPTSKGEEQQTGTSQTSDEVTVNKTEPSEPQVPEDIRQFTEANPLIYHNYLDTDAVADELEDHGEQFCLAGKITCIPRPTSIKYRFDLLMALQICGNQDGEQVLLRTPKTLDPHLFSKLMTAQEVRERISLQPQAPCLNLK